MVPVLFADSNVLIEALFIPQSAAYVIAEMVARGAFELVTCQLCVDDTEDAIVAKLGGKPDALDQGIAQWEKLKTDIRLTVLTDPDPAIVLVTETNIWASCVTKLISPCSPLRSRWILLPV
jgi:hypothetical protein